MKYILSLLLIMSGAAYGQSFAPADTCFNNTVTLITSNSARLNTNTGNGDVLGTIVVLKYVRVGHTDTTTSSAAWPNGMRNLTGLSAATQYVYYWAFSNGSEWVPQLGRYYFTTLANTISYTPQFNNYQYPYIKFDSGLKVPRHDTLLYRAPNTSGGDIVFKSPYFYGYNGTYWQQLAVDSAGIIPALNLKVDSVTVTGDSLFWYCCGGVAHGYILPINLLAWKTTGNAGTTPGTNFLGTTDGIGLMFKTNSQQSGYIDIVNNNTSFGLLSASSNSSGTYNTAFGQNALRDNVSGSRNIALGSFAGYTPTNLSFRLFVNSIDRSGTPGGDTTQSILYGAQDATAANQRLYINAKPIFPYVPSGAGVYAARLDAAGNLLKADTTLGGSTPTLQQVFNTEVGGSVFTKDDTLNLVNAKLRIIGTNNNTYFDGDEDNVMYSVNNANSTKRFRIDNSNSGANAAAGVIGYNDTGDEFAIQTTSSGYTAFGANNRSFLMHSNAQNGIQIASYRAFSGISFGVGKSSSGLGSDHITGAINGTTGNWILKDSSFTPTDLGQKLQVIGTAYISDSLLTAGKVKFSGLPTSVGTKAVRIDATGNLSIADTTTGGGSSGITVGTTAIASGTVGRILYEGASNVLQENSNLLWDNTNGVLGIGASTSSTAGRIAVSGGPAWTTAGWNKGVALSGINTLELGAGSARPYGLAVSGSKLFMFYADGETSGANVSYSWVADAQFTGFGGQISPAESVDVTGNIKASGTITPSDRRYKTKINPIKNSLGVVMSLKPSTYYYDTKKFPEQKFNEGKQYGLIAQDVEKVLPELVKTYPDTYKGLNYSELIPILISAIQEQQKQIEYLKSKIK